MQLPPHLPFYCCVVQIAERFSHKGVDGSIKKKELCAEKGICLRVIKDLKSSKKEIEAGISIVLNDLFGMGD